MASSYNFVRKSFYFGRTKFLNKQWINKTVISPHAATTLINRLCSIIPGGQRKVHNDGVLDTRHTNLFFNTFYLLVHFILPIDVINDAIGQCFFKDIACL